MRLRISSIQTHLIALGLALIVPGLILSGVLVQRFFASERARLHQEAREVARGLSLSIDREIGYFEAILESLSHSAALGTGTLAAFHEQASRALEIRGAHVILRDRSGQQLINTRVPWGTPLPVTGDPDTHAKVLATGHPVVSDLYVSNFSHTPIITVTTPVFRHGEAMYSLSIAIEPATIQAILRDRRLPSGWTAGIADRKNVVIARLHHHARLVGKSASDAVVAHMTGDEGYWAGRDANGSRVLAAYARSPKTEWAVVVGAPESLVLTPLYRSLWIIAAIGAALLAAALGLASLVGRRIASPLRSLAEAAAALGEGRPVAAVPSPVREVRDVGAALSGASAALAARDEALRRSAEEYRALAESLPALVWIARPDGAIMLRNRRVADYSGLSGFADLEACARLVHGDDRERAAALAEAGECRVEVRLLRHDGVYRWHQVRTTAVALAEDAEPCRLITAVDVEDLHQAKDLQHRLNAVLETRVAEATRQLQAETAVRLRAEEQLRQTQKMEAISRLAGGIAHDFNNKLMVISANIDAVVQRTKNQPQITRKLLSALVAADRAASLMGKLLTFARRQEVRAQYLDTAERLHSVVELLDRTFLTDQVAVDLVLPEGLWPLEADAHQLETAIVNLAINARDAMPDGGTLVIEAENLHLNPGEMSDLIGDFVCIAVRDSGQGVPPDHVDRVFEPFFTTKEAGKGTGLGLSEAYGFAKRLGGAIFLDSEVGEGTTVSLYLPRAVLPARLGRRPFDEDGGQDGRPAVRARLLLVEDDVDVAAACRAMLEELGYGVRVTLGAAEALDVFEAERPDLVLTDVSMPGPLDGLALARALRARYPALPVVLITGDPTAVADPDEFPLLAKPILSRRLDEAIRRHLGPADPAKVVSLFGEGRTRSSG